MKALAKLLWWHILLIGAGTAVIFALIFYFVKIKPTREEIETTNSSISTTETAGGTDVAVRGKDTELKNAKKATLVINQQWAVNSRYYMPDIDFPSDNLVGYERMARGMYRDERGQQWGAKDIPTVWGRWLGNWYDVQWKQGITRTVPITIGAMSTDPNAISQLTAISFPLDGKPWDMDVQSKTFDQGMDHLKRFNRMQHHGMPVVNNVALKGQSPDLHLAYQLAMYVIPSKLPPTADPMIFSEGAGTGGSGSTGGGGGGPAGGFGGSGGGASKKFIPSAAGGPGGK